MSANPLACVCVCVRVCLRVCAPEAINNYSSVMWCDIDPYDWLNKFYGFYMAVVVAGLHLRGGGGTRPPWQILAPLKFLATV